MPVNLRQVYLPNGVIVKVMVSSMQLNVWIMVPPGDWGLTRGQLAVVTMMTAA